MRRRQSIHLDVTIPKEQQKTPVFMFMESNFEVNVFVPINVVIDKSLLSQGRPTTPQVEGNNPRKNFVCVQLRHQGAKSSVVLSIFMRPRETNVRKGCFCLGSRIPSLTPMLLYFKPTGKGRLFVLVASACGENLSSRHYQKLTSVEFWKV